MTRKKRTTVKQVERSKRTKALWDSTAVYRDGLTYRQWMTKNARDKATARGNGGGQPPAPEGTPPTPDGDAPPSPAPVADPPAEKKTAPPAETKTRRGLMGWRTRR